MWAIRSIRQCLLFGIKPPCQNKVYFMFIVVCLYSHGFTHLLWKGCCRDHYRDVLNIPCRPWDERLLSHSAQLGAPPEWVCDLPPQQSTQNSGATSIMGDPSSHQHHGLAPLQDPQGTSGTGFPAWGGKQSSEHQLHWLCTVKTKKKLCFFGTEEAGSPNFTPAMKNRVCNSLSSFCPQNSSLYPTVQHQALSCLPKQRAVKSEV